MTCRLVAVCIDANDPLRLARFWAETLGWNVGDFTDVTDEVVELLPTDETSFRLDFARVPEKKSGLSRLHFDLTTRSQADQDDSVARLLALGASHLDVGQTADDRHVVLADPEGNEFCVIEPDNVFLRGCPRLGAVSCDGTRAVGYFWSEVLGWPLVWDHNEETAIQAPDGTGPKISWGGPPVKAKPAKNRLHFDIAARDGSTQVAEVERLVALGGRRIDIGQGDVPWVVMADPDGNEFCVLSSRD